MRLYAHQLSELFAPILQANLFPFHLLEEYRLIMERSCASPSHGEVCRRERKLLLGLHIPDSSKGKGQTKCSLWSSRLGVGRWAYYPTPEKLTVTKPRRRPRSTQGCSGSEEEENSLSRSEGHVRSVPGSNDLLPAASQIFMTLNVY
jgi:hypothetical protein